MASQDEATYFENELKQRFDELVLWAVRNRPYTGASLKPTDFDDSWKQIARLTREGIDLGKRNAAVPEPSENGPQYVNSNPAPWP
ncbi:MULTISPECIES: hypothetical protein [Oxalobacteraceae]|uniref:hypothetical protein n=1 Tax=Herminiimonas sp. Marseille-P9896 TaxID=2742211 RepID=UPI00158D6988|nr:MULTISPECIES: hypothetical protein [Oxalobacteraceae]